MQSRSHVLRRRLLGLHIASWRRVKREALNLLALWIFNLANFFKGLSKKIARHDCGMTNTEVRFQDVCEASDDMKKALEAFAQSEALWFRVLLFGSNSTKREDPLWHLAYQFAKGLAERGFDIVTGHGYGLMEAFHEGFNSVSNPRIKSSGVPLALPGEDKMRGELSLYPAEDFPGRLMVMDILSMSSVIFPGGFGVFLEGGHFLQHIQFMKRHGKDAQGGRLKNLAARCGFIPAVLAFNWGGEGEGAGYFDLLRSWFCMVEAQGNCRPGESELLELEQDFERIYQRLEEKRAQWRKALREHGYTPQN